MKSFNPNLQKTRVKPQRQETRVIFHQSFNYNFAGKVLDVQGEVEDRKVQSQNLATTHVSNPVIVFLYVQLAMTLLSLLHEFREIKHSVSRKGFLLQVCDNYAECKYYRWSVQMGFEEIYV